ncbi:MAG: NUDIX hydrolase [bacterium]
MDGRKYLLNDPRLVEAQCFSLIPVETVHENPWFAVRNRKGYFTVEYNMPQVLILPIVDNNSIVMVRVDRPVVADRTLEVPAGGLKDNELPVETAGRELAEETGILISDLNRFQMLPPLIHMLRSPVLPYIFQIHLTRQEFDSRGVHDNEIVSVECFTFNDILEKIAEGEIYIGFQIAIIAKYLINRKIIKI